MSQLRFTVIGLGGFGLVHLEAIKWLQKQKKGKLVGVVALETDRKKRPDLVESLKEAGVHFYDTVDHFFNEGVETTDVLTIPIGIHQHVPVSIRAMRAGLDVYCEKPIAATVQEADRLIRVKKETQRTVAIGYQHIYSHSVTQIKDRIIDGRLGCPSSIKIMCGWPRSTQYYNRNRWTGRLKLDGEWILDTIANNACAHFVLNMLYLSTQRSSKADASIENVQAEWYRAYDIESADTVAFRFKTNDDTEGYAFLTHANRYENGPKMHISCENGTVYWQTNNGVTQIQYDDGKTESFSNSAHTEWAFAGFEDLVDAIRNDRSPLCTPALARKQTTLINIMHDSCPIIKTIPSSFIEQVEDWEMFPPDTKGLFSRVINMDEDMHVGFEEGLLPSEMNIPWAMNGSSKMISLRDYDHYPQSNSDITK